MVLIFNFQLVLIQKVNYFNIHQLRWYYSKIAKHLQDFLYDVQHVLQDKFIKFSLSLKINPFAVYTCINFAL